MEIMVLLQNDKSRSKPFYSLLVGLGYTQSISVYTVSRCITYLYIGVSFHWNNIIGRWKLRQGSGIGSRNWVNPEIHHSCCVDWWVILSMQTVLFCIFGWQKTSYWCQLHQEIATNFLAANAIDAANELLKVFRNESRRNGGHSAVLFNC